MRVTFVRMVDGPDRVYVQRDDGSETSWSFPSYGEGLPHDLVHLVAEDRLGVTPGIWGRIAQGMDLARINARANRAGGAVASKYAVMGDLRDVLLSESLACAPWHSADVTDDERLENVRFTAAGLGIDLPAHIDAAAVQGLRELLDDLAARWRALPPRHALVFRYPRVALVA